MNRVYKHELKSIFINLTLPSGKILKTEEEWIVDRQKIEDMIENKAK